MELRTYLRILIRRWWLVLAPVVVVAVYVVLTFETPPPSYSIVMKFATGTSPSGLSEDYDRFYSWRTSEYIAGGLADLAKTGVFAQAIADRLESAHPNLAAGTVQAGINTDYTRSILVIYLNYGDPALASAIAGAIAEEVTTSAAAYFPQVEGVEPAARLLDAPNPAQTQPGLLQQLLDPAVKLGLALCVGVALALLWHYLKPENPKHSEPISAE
jgi:capsular polysaccharide biosynthesis protein